MPTDLKPLTGKKVSDTFPDEYLEKRDFVGKQKQLTIKMVFQTEVWNQHQGKKVTRVALTFKETSLLLYASRSDVVAIAGLYGEVYDGWLNKPLVISAVPDPRNSKNLSWKFSGRGAAPSPTQTATSTPTKKASRPMSPESLRAALVGKANGKDQPGEIALPVAQAVAACLARAFTPVDPEATTEENKLAKAIGEAHYRDFIKYVFPQTCGAPPSAKNLTHGQGLAILDWLTDGVIKTTAQPGEMAVKEGKLVIETVLNDPYVKEPESSDGPTDDTDEGDDIHGDDSGDDVPW